MKNILKINTSLFLLLIVLMLTGCSAKRLVKKAYKTYEIGEYSRAADLFKRAAKKTKKDRKLTAQIYFDQAECYRHTNQLALAAARYKIAIRFKYPDTISYLRAAQVSFELGKYKEAKKYLQTYWKKDSVDLRVQNMMVALDSINSWKKVTTRYEVESAKLFNDRKSSSYSPAFMGEPYDAILFTADREGLNPNKTNPITGARPTDMFIARKSSTGKWLEPNALDQENINTEFDEGTPFVTKDGSAIYFTRCRFEAGKDLGAEIFRTEKSGAKWSEPKKITLLSDSLADSLIFAHPTVFPDESEIIFVSDMAGGFGGKDLWSAKKVDDVFSEPVNLGPAINTPGDEMFPYLRNDKTLYFSSDGHQGFGGLDIYKAVWNDELSNWEVFNMMMPINSNADDFGITFAGETESGFFSSNRKDRKGMDHLYSFIEPVPSFVMEGIISDAKTKEALPDAYVRLIGNDGTNTKIRTRKDGSFIKELNKDVKYIYLAAGRGYLNQKGELNTLGLEDSKNFTVDFALSSIKKPIRLKNITYEFNKWTLTKEAKFSLKDLVKILSDNPKITIEISAHTDYVGTDTTNMVLSNKRAESVVRFLISQGVEKDRLTPKGYGESQPVTVDDELAKQHRFLKKGVVLNERFVKSLREQSQEVVNQVNRRTEFKVLSTNYKSKRKSNWRKKYSVNQN